ncbi:hypothetical protein DIPPA_25675 [Diplonema papillatum]|nr:hypothetical protein DIPPA_25675 [Diplonema papillatum]
MPASVGILLVGCCLAACSKGETAGEGEKGGDPSTGARGDAAGRAAGGVGAGIGIGEGEGKGGSSSKPPANPGAGEQSCNCDCRANEDHRVGASFEEGNGDEKAAFGGSGSWVGFVLAPFRTLFNKLVLAEQRNAPAHSHPTRDGEDAGGSGGGAKEGDRFAAVVLTCFLFLFFFFFMFFLTMFFFLAFCVIVLPYLLRRAGIMVAFAED